VRTLGFALILVLAVAAIAGVLLAALMLPPPGS
jgi:hypothetical protein